MVALQKKPSLNHSCVHFCPVPFESECTPEVVQVTNQELQGRSFDTKVCEKTARHKKERVYFLSPRAVNLLTQS